MSSTYWFDRAPCRPRSFKTSGNDARYCGYRCDGEGPCPTGMSCYDFGDGVGVCEYD